MDVKGQQQHRIGRFSPSGNDLTAMYRYQYLEGDGFLSCRSKTITTKAKGEIPSSIKRNTVRTVYQEAYGTAQQVSGERTHEDCYGSSAKYSNYIGFHA